jgi:LmbE family N-acetylglucosaminyl deacetylase
MAYRRAMRTRNLRFTTTLRHEAGAPALLLSPHLDDAVLDCWSLLVAPGDLTVVNVFAGVPPAGRVTTWDRIVGASDSAALMRARRAEDRDALALAGREPVSLGFLESQQRPHGPEPSFRALDRAIAGAASTTSRVLAPMTLGTVHPDHRLLRDYALAVARAGVPVSLYADVPYATVYGWPAWVTGEPPDPHLDVDAYWAAALAAVPGRGEPRVVKLDPDRAAAKQAAMRGYRTQFPSLDRGPIGQLSNPLVHPYEVFWDLT